MVKRRDIADNFDEFVKRQCIAIFPINLNRYLNIGVIYKMVEKHIRFYVILFRNSYIFCQTIV